MSGLDPRRRCHEAYWTPNGTASAAIVIAFRSANEKPADGKPGDVLRKKVEPVKRTERIEDLSKVSYLGPILRASQLAEFYYHKWNIFIGQLDD